MESELGIEMHGTVERQIAGSECHRAPLLPGVKIECPWCDHEFFVCTTCKKPCKTVVVGTQEVTF